LFFFKNKIDPKNLAKFPFLNKREYTSVSIKRKNRSLVGVGGGKDSIVSVELLKADKFDIEGFVVETGKKYQEVEDILRISKIKALKINRIIDEKLLNNKFPGSYNGHVPISSIYAFLGIFSAIIYDYRYVIVSNEYSSNFGNINYIGQEVNHQWSKSQEFESLLRRYSIKYLTGDIVYFSILRPFYEIRIAKIFSRYSKYFSYFSSCNSRFKISKKRSHAKWCGYCPKCVFVFNILAPFLPKNQLIKIFGKNLYDDRNLEQTFLDIFGMGKMKPFECVGTFDESLFAFLLIKERFKGSFIVDKIVRKIKSDIKIKEDVLSTHLSFNIPPQFEFIGMEKILIGGYEREGKESYKYIKDTFPRKKTSIVRSVDTSGYKDKEKLYDIVIKSPGIPRRKMSINYTTATNIFLSKIYGKNQIIGVTGSKGKSTTASMIYEILKKAEVNVKFFGNIGSPMLSGLTSIMKKDIIILELSSYQLADIKCSPNIAVVTNLFPDHMDYHGGLSEYYLAKKNIINFQNKSDIFFYNKKNNILDDWAGVSVAKSIDFSKKDTSFIETNLLGEHNAMNIKAAVSVARYLGVNNHVIRTAIASFDSLPHRMEFIGNFYGINFYDDAISTTPDSTLYAIKSLPQVETIFLGGEDRGYDFSNLEKEILRSKIKNVVLFPVSGNKLFARDNRLNVLRTESMEKAVKFAYKNTTPGNSCLLSCASPSYSLWKNFEDKGDKFKKYVFSFAKKEEKNNRKEY